MRRLPRRGAPTPAVVAAPSRRVTAAAGALVVLAAGALAMTYPPVPPRPQSAPSPVPSATSASAFRRIILPDLLVIAPHGLTAAQLARIGRLAGVRNVIAADGAAIQLAGHQVNVLGVDPRQFRSWTPLATASDQHLWTALARGRFVTSDSVARRLRLHQGAQYRLAGLATQNLVFGGGAPLGVAGIDVLVSNSTSAQLGLVRGVAALISAPGTGLTALTSAVRAVTGAADSIVSLRGAQLPVDSAASAGRPATYLELFKQSAADFCPGLSWTVLAAIGQIESGDGSNVGPSSAGALGPMQFLPATWQEWGITAFGESGPPNIMDPYDAVPAAARLLCAAGAGTPAGLPGAIFAYNHATWYVNEVLGLAREYAQTYG